MPSSGRATGGLIEVEKDIETHGDGTGEQLVTVTLSLKKGTSPCAAGSKEDKAKVSGFI